MIEHLRVPIQMAFRQENKVARLESIICFDCLDLVQIDMLDVEKDEIHARFDSVN